MIQEINFYCVLYKKYGMNTGKYGYHSSWDWYQFKNNLGCNMGMFDVEVKQL